MLPPIGKENPMIFCPICADKGYTVPDPHWPGRIEFCSCTLGQSYKAVLLDGKEVIYKDKPTATKEGKDK